MREYKKTSHTDERDVTYPDLADNLSDLRLKAHVKHAIGFVNDEVGGATQVGLVVLQQVNQTAGSCNADLSTYRAINQPISQSINQNTSTSFYGLSPISY